MPFSDALSNMNCTCGDYADLELERGDISRRSKQSKHIKSVLSLVAEHPKGEHKLFRCPMCEQLWQQSRAWNWGDVEYLFKVPPIAVCDWELLPYVAPDELLIYAAVLDRFLSGKTFRLTGKKCRLEDCERQAIEFSVHCLRHHIESLQQIRNLPKTPVGRWFDPYRGISPETLERYVEAKQP
jgi:hypothetical protein